MLITVAVVVAIEKVVWYSDNNGNDNGNDNGRRPSTNFQLS